MEGWISGKIVKGIISAFDRFHRDIIVAHNGLQYLAPLNICHREISKTEQSRTVGGAETALTAPQSNAHLKLLLIFDYYPLSP